MLSPASPDALYRGIQFDPNVLADEAAFTATLQGEGGLTPGSLKINDKGERCVSSGDEYGVYMTPAQDIAEAYALTGVEDHRLGRVRPYVSGSETVEFTLPDDRFGSIRTRLGMPSLGVVYEIKRRGLNLRTPRYRDGREVTAHELATIPELITDHVPQANVRPVSVHIGPDMVEPYSMRFNPDDLAASKLHARISRLYKMRLGNLAFLAQTLRTLPDAHDPTSAQRALDIAQRLR
jgi:hypothetical protein